MLMYVPRVSQRWEDLNGQVALLWFDRDRSSGKLVSFGWREPQGVPRIFESVARALSATETRCSELFGSGA